MLIRKSSSPVRLLAAASAPLLIVADGSPLLRRATRTAAHPASSAANPAVSLSD
jgi:hypothetical protein